MSTSIPLRSFDPHDEYFVIERSDLPHWTQPGTVCFITWRTWDSLPQVVLGRWLAARADWLRSKGIDPMSKTWRQAVERLPAASKAEFRTFVTERWESQLDECHGTCVLRENELAQIVAKSLLHFNGDRYVLTDFVVMPNHVHLLAAFPTEEGLLKQCDSWKHFTAVELNRALRRKGRFWEEDQFDHLVRSDDDFQHYRAYIAENPRKAGLKTGAFIHYSNPV